MARASDRIAAAEVTFFFLSCRQPKIASARSESSHDDQPDVAALFARSAAGSRTLAALPPGSRPCSMASCDVRLELFVDLAAQAGARETHLQYATITTYHAILAPRGPGRILRLHSIQTSEYTKRLDER